MTPAEPIDRRFWSPVRRQRWGVMLAVAAAASAYASLASWSDRHVFLVNQSTSLPSWAFLVDRHRLPARGDTIFFDPPASRLLERHFGRDHPPFGKIVYGIPGDVVSRRGRLFLVNGRAVALAKERTLRGESLALGPTGIVPRGCYFVGTPNKDSFDSRYALIGWVCGRQLIGVGKAIL